MLKRNFSDVKETGDFSPVPEGTYGLKIISTKEGQSGNGDPQVNVELEIFSPTKYIGKKVFHRITFIEPGQPGAGFSKHWLHVIGQPYEGEVVVRPEQWRGARLESDLTIEEYEGKDNTMKKKNTLNNIRSFDPEGVGSPLLNTVRKEPAREPGDKVPF